MSEICQRRRPTIAIAGLMLVAATGCSITTEHFDAPAGHGQVYYLDGAGGGGPTGGWGRGVEEGLKLAGYQGGFHGFTWHTGLGVVADQDASAEYKRSKAATLAEMICAYADAHPGEPINLIGLSAGTAVAVFTLEALPEDHAIDNVILLGASLSSTYDLSAALKRVRNRLYVFTSTRDTVLEFLVPMTGTADRRPGTVASGGLHGFVLPPAANVDTRRLYARIVNIAWRPEYERDGDYGGHTDTVHPRFVRDYIAPLVLQEGPRFMQAGPRPQLGTQSPDRASESAPQR